MEKNENEKREKKEKNEREEKEEKEKKGFEEEKNTSNSKNKEKSRNLIQFLTFFPDLLSLDCQTSSLIRRFYEKNNSYSFTTDVVLGFEKL
ncbi:hypothetical protein BpHYR1_025811 [Brachionus plicatilis]|uniref:Uncharacterized protein n=1 Tax=Brachionus plicatilis TaxID=10195 RepID=A0A3M7PPK4_BRAPC|nr:hypothetical protein BpHYR1_025811 [Brachionus plicatilis]